MSSLPFLAVKVANTLIMCHSDQVFIVLSDSQDQKLLMHHWHLFLGCGNQHVSFLFTDKNSQYNHFGFMWLCSPLIAENVRLKIMDALLILTLMTDGQSLDDHQFYAIMRIEVIANKYIISMYKHLHPKASRPVNFWSITRHDISAINGIGLSRPSTFSWQSTACRSIQ